MSEDEVKKSLMDTMDAMGKEYISGTQLSVILGNLTVEKVMLELQVKQLQAQLLEQTQKPEAKKSPNEEEEQYLNLCRLILEKGVEKGDRTGTGTKQIFGATMRFSLEGGKIPMLTTKSVFWKGIKAELMWMLRGQTDATILADQGVHIWDANSTREFLDKRELKHLPVGDIGKGYGFQWRHWGAEYKDCKTDYKGQGFDQLAEAIRMIKEDPDSRRIVVSAWNPPDLKKMALPPCHMFFQFCVTDCTKGEGGVGQSRLTGKKLSCIMYQRSCDMGLGVPFNIAFYSLLTHLVADACGLEADEFIHMMGDVHIYKDHIDGIKTQLIRTPKPFPTLKINKHYANVWDYCLDDIELIGYDPHPAIKLKMAV